MSKILTQIKTQTEKPSPPKPFRSALDGWIEKNCSQCGRRRDLCNEFTIEGRQTMALCIQIHLGAVNAKINAYGVNAQLERHR